MEPATRFSHRHSLHPVAAAFVLQRAVGPASMYLEDHFFHAARCTLAGAYQFKVPSPPFGIPRVHAVELPRKQRRLFTAGAGPDLHDHVLVVVRIAWHEE